MISLPVRRTGQLKACDPSAEADGVCSGEGRTGSGLSSFPAGSPKAINAIFFMG